jgi:hypothetical protein
VIRHLSSVSPCHKRSMGRRSWAWELALGDLEDVARALLQMRLTGGCDAHFASARCEGPESAAYLDGS